MDTNQIYTIVNETAQEALGKTAITATNTQSLVSLGNVILSSKTNTEAFLDKLPQRIGKTIFSFRAYRNKFGGWVLGDFEMGAILQKIKVSMPEAIEDPSYDLVSGQSVDPYKVYKQEVDNKLFVKRTPYVYPITVARKQLKEAFLNESALGSFISYMFGEVRNAIEYGMENLARACLGNFVAESQNEVKLVTNYNALFNETLTATEALYDEKFLRYAIGVIKQYSKELTDMSVSYNDGTETRHTPFEDQKLIILSQLQTNLETNVEYAAFHERFVSLEGFTEVNYWQAKGSPMTVQVERASDGVATTVANLVAVLHDRDALGIYQEDEDVLTTPVNALGRYYNTFYHLMQLWFNDLSENFVFFTLN